MSENFIAGPPLAKEVGEIEIFDADFDQQCLALFQRMAENQGWRIKQAMITKSAKWGRLWRADFDVRGLTYRSAMLNRLMCWEDRTTGLSAHAAFGQRLEPLRARAVE